ncbi:hypothetical protein E2C01_009954 [Portunus trituberculatus]|uniref:Uncharacterized protein n=1 Tax=Portunus trituberculatus TaxID=210409 RepID=A0A5B7D736_PORTR|nr:hypothetical protein [Portunus trituberculatus]
MAASSMSFCGRRQGPPPVPFGVNMDEIFDGVTASHPSLPPHCDVTAEVVSLPRPERETDCSGASSSIFD